MREGGWGGGRGGDIDGIECCSDGVWIGIVKR